MVPVTTALIIDNVTTMSEFSPQYGQPQCWFNSDYGLYFYFLIPIAVILLLNFVTYIIIIIRFAILAYQTRKAKSAHKEKLIISVKLFFAFGLLWIFGILSAVFPNNPAISCIFIFINTLSGMLLMLVFICNHSVINSFRTQVTSLTSQSDVFSTKPNYRLEPKVATSSDNRNLDTQEPLNSSQL